jgi:hypothetical protein
VGAEGAGVGEAELAEESDGSGSLVGDASAEEGSAGGRRSQDGVLGLGGAAGGK